MFYENENLFHFIKTLKKKCAEAHERQVMKLDFKVNTISRNDEQKSAREHGRNAAQPFTRETSFSGKEE